MVPKILQSNTLPLSYTPIQGTQHSEWQRNFLSVLEIIYFSSYTNGSALYILSHFLLFPLNINYWHLTQISTQKASSFFFVSMFFPILWRSHQSLIYRYLRCSQSCLIRNCAVIINFKHMTFCTWEDKHEWYFLDLERHCWIERCVYLWF